MESTVNLTFLGGVDEIGGNTVLLEDFAYDVKIFIDFGIKIQRYYNNYGYGEHPSSIEDLINLNLIPNEADLSIRNLYTNMGSKIKVKGKNRGKSEHDSIDYLSPSNLDAILISHSHKDHFFGLSFVNRSIPIYTGVVTRKIIRAFYKSSKSTIDNNFKGLNWKTFRTGEILDINGLKVVPYHVDHSIPAAYGFIIYTSTGPIVYTGDFRMHGPLSHMTKDFLQEAKTNKACLSNNEFTEDQKELVSKGVKVLICEGTKIHKGIVESEQEVEDNLNKLFERNPFDYILVRYDRIDWDRFRTFSHIAKRYGWKYIITEKDAYFYYLLNKDAIHDTMRDPDILNNDHILILKRGNAKYKWQEKIRQIMYINKKGDRFLKDSDLKKLEGKYFVYITQLDEFLIKNLDFSRRSVFISSSIDPYAEEFYDNTNSITEKLKVYGIPAYRIHASGHATPHDIINFIEEVRPEILIPIHTEHPKFFEMLFKNSNIKVRLPTKNQPIHI